MCFFLEVSQSPLLIPWLSDEPWASCPRLGPASTGPGAQGTEGSPGRRPSEGLSALASGHGLGLGFHFCL